MKKLEKSKISHLLSNDEKLNVQGFSICGCGKNQQPIDTTTPTSGSICGKKGSTGQEDVSISGISKCGDSDISITTSGTCGIRIIDNGDSIVPISGTCGVTGIELTTPLGCGNSDGDALNPQTPLDPNNYHCDILAYNKAVENGYNAGSWDGNSLTVNDIVTRNYSNNISQSMNGDAGYGFVDHDNNGTFDHMFYYQKTANGYEIWDSNGINPLEKKSSQYVNSAYINSGKTVKYTSLNK